MAREYEEYFTQAEHGATAHDVFRVATRNGLTVIERIPLIRVVFGLSLIEAKAVYIECDTGKTLEEHQEDLIPDIDAFFRACKDEEREDV